MLVNYCVLDKTSNKVVLPWNIVCAGASGDTVQQFFDEHVGSKLEELVSASLGKALFGPFLRFYVNNLNQPPRLDIRNASVVLMASARSMSSPCLPEYVNVRTKKDQLYIMMC